jgi:anti-sigma factor RsiW
MTDRWTDSLSEYADGELTPEDRTELGRHLEGCAECAATLEEIEQVTERARSLADWEPGRDLWPAIEARLSSRPPASGTNGDGTPRLPKPWPRVVSLTWPELVAAGLAVAALSTAAFWLGTHGERAGTRVGVPTISGDASPASRQDDSEAAIAELREALARGRDDLDTSTVRVLEQNLLVIARSIAEARTALAADPANPYLRRHLQETMRRKVSLMRQATLVASAP